MSAFSITVSTRALGTAVKALDGVTVRALANAKVAKRDSTMPSWAGERVHLTGTEHNPDLDRTVIVAWVVDEDDMAEYRVTIDPQDLAGLVIL